MSRYSYKLPTPKNDIVEVAYGFDQATQFFFQGFDAEDECIMDYDSLFTHLSGAQLAELLERFDVPVPGAHRSAMFMDLSF